MKKSIILVLGLMGISVLVVAVSGCIQQQNNQTSFHIRSSAFVQGGQIPQKYTANGQNVSPPLTWTSPPSNTKSFTIICEDSDTSTSSGGLFCHWIIFNIPGNATQLEEGITNQKTLDNGIKQGTNDFGRIGYSGPSPPNGTHRYVFKIYALDTILNLEPGVTKQHINDAIQGHILSQTQITGKYGTS
jgi:Raf kinase inhibitor-like YbhB/YbcL family protein